MSWTFPTRSPLVSNGITFAFIRAFLLEASSTVQKDADHFENSTYVHDSQHDADHHDSDDIDTDDRQKTMVGDDDDNDHDVIHDEMNCLPDMPAIIENSL